MSNLSEYLPYAVALIIAIPFLVLLRQFVHSFITLKNQEIKLLTVKSNSENKAQAYERMMLFLERIKPSNLITKFNRDLEIHEFVFLTEKTINEEFDYNASQQLYMSKNAWQNVVDCKLNISDLLHKTYSEMGENASLEEFKTVFLMAYMNGDDYISSAMDNLRREILLVA